MNFEKAARPLVMGRSGVISSGHSLASLAGVKILQEGGNAVDAALAAAFVMTVVKPDTCGPGGDLFALVYIKKTGKVEALNASGPAPGKATIDYFQEGGLNAIPFSGPLSVAVPGAVDGWLELHRKYATMDLPRLTLDAVRLAREGFPAQQDLVERIEELSSQFPWIDRVYRRPLNGPRAGKVLYQKGLGDVLERIALRGREGFYG
ncbi:MAG: gamma-glutamyltransferase, partial [Candidatus Binatia bacterium]